MRRPPAAASMAILALALTTSLLFRLSLATSIVVVDADGTVVQSSSDQRNSTVRKPPPPPNRAIVPVTVAVATDGGKPNRTAVADALAAATGAAVADLDPTKRADAGMPCPKRTCAAWTASLTMGDNVTAARALRVGVDAGGTEAAALARAVLAATPNATAASVQYTAGLYADDLPPGLDDDDDDDAAVNLGRGKRLAAGAVVAIVAAALLLVASVAGMAGTVMAGCWKGKKAGVAAAAAAAAAGGGGAAAAAASAAATTTTTTATPPSASPFLGSTASQPITMAPAAPSEGTRMALSASFDRTATV